jgi:hypothetical protein
MKKLIMYSIFFLICTHALATSRVGNAEVRIQGNLVCFTITHEEFQRGSGKMTYQGYSVYERSGEIWGYNLNPIPFKEGDCFAYAILPEGAEVTNEAANNSSNPPPELNINRLYTVYVNADTHIKTDPAKFYAAQFCLQKKDDLILIAQVNATNYKSCEQIREKMK